MSTYEFDKVLSEYANGRMPVEMAMGHSLQHIGRLYAALAAVTTNRVSEQVKIDTIEKRVNTMQGAVDRLTAFMEKIRVRSKRNPPSPSKPD